MENASFIPVHGALSVNRPIMHFLFPELFLLAIPMGVAYWRWGRDSGMTGAIRFVILALLLLALTGPELDLGGEGLDVVVIVDRSRSMPTGADDNIRELIGNLQKQRGTGDRLGIVAVGSTAAVEQILSRDSIDVNYTQEILRDGSDLNSGIQAALEMIDPHAQRRRPARILVFSDGEANGASPNASARKARELGIPIDFREFPLLRVGDVAVDSLSLPEAVAPREPFQFSAWIFADKDSSGRIELLRDGKTITTQDREFPSGMSRVLFRDILESGGLYRYDVKITVNDDPLTANNLGTGVVRVDAGRRVLVLNADGQADNFTRALQNGKLAVDVAVAPNFPLTQDSLDNYRAVVLENVPAADFGRVKMQRLAQFVEDLGGGLLVTGGERSFGIGGYFKSPLDEVLPVSMELRDEHRKTRVAIAVALDRSGSMSMPVKGGKTKMDLANLGTAECVKLLSAGDSFSVIAVDSEAHIIQPLTNVDDTAAITAKIRRIESMGGGIYVYNALVAAGTELMKAEQATKHIILFSDTQDSEEPGAYKQLLEKYEKSGITVSVIGLGTSHDVDSKLLEDIAKRGSGQVMFTADPAELPRLFTQDTMAIARSSFIKKDPETQPTGIPGRMLSDARLMGEFVPGAFPAVEGYNLNYLRPGATAAVVSQDEYVAPWAAFWYRGIGRAAAITLEVDGQYSGRFGSWEDYNDFLITHARWLLGGDDPDDVYLTIDRQGQEAVVTLQLDPQRDGSLLVDAPTLNAVLPGDEREEPLKIPFIWRGADTLEARFLLSRTGTYHTIVQLGPRKYVRGPVVTLPYSPEFSPRADENSGGRILRDLAEISGGTARIDALEIFRDPPRAAGMQPLAIWLLAAGIVLLVIEIAGRRLSLWSKLTEATETVGEKSRGWRSWLPEARAILPRRRPKQAVPDHPPQAESPAPPPRPQEQSAEAPSAQDIFRQAKNRAKKRLQDEGGQKGE